MARVLVAGIGNIFLGDDGFGTEVARRLAADPLPEGVRVEDFGIRGLHLAYECLDGRYDDVILVDAAPRGGCPGTLYLLDIDPRSVEPGRGEPDAHAMTPEAVLSLIETLGGSPARFRLVGCEPAHMDEGMGLSDPVEQAVGLAVRLIRELLQAESDSQVGRERRGQETGRPTA